MRNAIAGYRAVRCAEWSLWDEERYAHPISVASPRAERLCVGIRNAPIGGDYARRP
ncbi:hypothetical protein GCM10023321_02120 [Pseudonocardia eucalypti]|uniref:Uncharacterized protein n=1 Tax=Pseudonocardia eucalypti TaxID=648755 RepID=A0ABP9PDR2_9PSEU